MHRSGRARALAAVLGVALLVGAIFPSSAAAAAPSLKDRVVQSGLQYPWDVDFLPGGQMLVTERAGRLKVFASGAPGAALLGSFKIGGVHAVGEAGLMGVAVDPNFATNRRIYLCASRMDNGVWRNQLLRYRLDQSYKPTNRKFLIRYGMKANNIHNGCAVEIIKGKLWLTMGDAADRWLAQDPTSLNGKVLRLNLDGSIPSGNPIMPGASQRTAVYSMGHRNPQGIDVRPGKGWVYVAEHGPERDDEINRIRPGRNYGWPCYTGMGRTYLSDPRCGPRSQYTNPRWTSGFPTIATSGLRFIRGAKWGSWRGQLFVAQLKERDLRRFRFDDAQRAIQRQVLYNEKYGRLRGVALNAKRHLFLTTSNGTNDKIIRVVPSQ